MKITKQDFLNKVDRHSCNGTIVEGGKAKQGHDKCDGCQGNYLYGGECNFGGEHTVDNDLIIINQNFDRFDILLQKQDNLSKAVSETDFNNQKKSLINDFNYLIRKCEATELDFFAGTCISIESKQHIFLEQVKQYLRILAEQVRFFIEEVKEMDYHVLKRYRDKTERLERAIKEAAQTAVDYQAAVDRGDEAEATRLLALLTEQKKVIASLELEVKNDPLDKLFGAGIREKFKGIVGAIWKGDTDFLDWIDKKTKKKNPIVEKKIWGFIPQKHWKKVKWGGIILISIVLIWLIIRWIYKKIK